MLSRERSSSARSQNSEFSQRQISTPSPSQFPAGQGKPPSEDLVLNDVPSYGQNTSQSSLVIPSQGVGSPYPAISGSVPQTPSLQRPRASTDRAVFRQGGPPLSLHPAFQQNQRQASVTSSMDTRAPYIPGPPPQPPHSSRMLCRYLHLHHVLPE